MTPIVALGTLTCHFSPSACTMKTKYQQRFKIDAFEAAGKDGFELVPLLIFGHLHKKVKRWIWQFFSHGQIPLLFYQELIRQIYKLTRSWSIILL